MANCIFGWSNLILSGVLTAGSSASGLDVGKLQTQHGSPSTAWQTAAGVTTSWFALDAGIATAWDAFSLHRTNLTPSARVRWRIGTDTAQVYDSGLVSAHRCRAAISAATSPIRATQTGS